MRPRSAERAVNLSTASPPRTAYASARRAANFCGSRNSLKKAMCSYDHLKIGPVRGASAPNDRKINQLLYYVLQQILHCVTPVTNSWFELSPSNRLIRFWTIHFMNDLGQMTIVTH